MRNVYLLAAAVASILSTAAVSAAEISGQYLEARTCDVYTGPCFANAEINISGKEALMAWKVEQGTYNDVPLEGLSVALVLKAEGTLGDDGVFGMDPGRVDAVILVDAQANQLQREALIRFVKDSAGKLAENVVSVRSVPMTLENDHLDGRGIFTAGKLAKIETRALQESDCVCTNEIIYYQPLAKVQNFSPAYSMTISYQGKDLNSRWTSHGLRSAFLATFRR